MLCESVMVDIFVAVTTLTTVGIIAYYKWIFKYWSRINVPVESSPTIPFGNADRFFSNPVHFGIYFKDSYKRIKAQGFQHGGGFLFFIPKYMPIDPELIKNILQRDFDHFTERGFYCNEKDDPLSANLFALGGERWKNLRSRLSPAFTPGKLRMMFDMVVKCGRQMRDEVEDLHRDGKTIDIKELAVSFTIDVIGSCSFGLECNSFKNPDAEFKKFGKRAFDFTSMLRLARVIFAFVLPNVARLLKITLFDKETTNFFVTSVRDTLKFREDNKAVRNDMMQLLIELKNESEVNDPKFEKGTDMKIIKEIAAQAFIFFAAGFETSSTTLTYCLYELALNTKIQAKIRRELHQVLAKHDEKVTYDAVMDMKYLSQVVDETLRKYPPVPYLTRVCIKDYTIPQTDVVIEKGIEAIIPIMGLHHDPDYFPDPEKFDPQRFSEENKPKILPYTYIPFGEGPRICIGLRLGLMQTKVGLISLLKDYKFSLNEQTEVPVQINPFSFTLISKSGIFLNVEKVINC